MYLPKNKEEATKILATFSFMGGFYFFVGFLPLIIGNSSDIFFDGFVSFIGSIVIVYIQDVAQKYYQENQ